MGAEGAPRSGLSGRKMQWMAWTLLPIVLVVLLIPLQRHYQRRQLALDVQKCLANLKNIGTAAEMYSTDNCGRYPPRLAALVPRYMPQLPVCPATMEDTYSAGYVSVSIPDNYTVTCLGEGHLGIPPGEHLRYAGSRCIFER